MTYYDVIKNALQMFNDRYKYAYFYGAKGQRLTNATMDALIASEPAYWQKYSKSEIASIKNWSLNKIGYDCSGFINAITGQYNYSTGYYDSCPVKTTPRDGVEGSCLYTTFGGTGRHIGIDIGKGFFLHMAKEDQSVTFGKISDYAWEKSGQIKGIDYKGGLK